MIQAILKFFRREKELVPFPPIYDPSLFCPSRYGPDDTQNASTDEAYQRALYAEALKRSRPMSSYDTFENVSRQKKGRPDD